MKYFSAVAKAIYTVFIILTVGVLVLALGLSAKVPILFERYIGYIYLTVLFITIATIIIHIVIGFFILIKKEGVLKVVKMIGIFFISGVAFAIILSLLKYKILFSLDYLYLPIMTTVIIPFVSVLFDQKN